MKVIHDGYKNNPELKKRLLRIIRDIKIASNRDDCHLSDCGCILGFIRDDLNEVIDDTFKAHKIEKES